VKVEGLMSDDPQITVGRLMAMLMTAAEDERFGLETPVKFGVCDAVNLQIIDHVELVEMFDVDRATLAPTDAWLMFKAHHHPGTKPGDFYPGAAAEIDQDEGQEPPKTDE
jgi:hypothetical protein